MNIIVSRLYNRYKNKLTQLHSMEAKQFKLEEHLASHPTDYQSVIQNEILKSDIKRVEYALKEIEREMEYYGE